jgi:hypothetical protein
MFLIILFLLQAAVITPETVVLILTPVVIYLVTYLIDKYLVRIPSGMIPAILVPVLSLAAAWLASLIIPETNFWLRCGAGLLAVFIAEIMKRVAPGMKRG